MDLLRLLNWHFATSLSMSLASSTLLSFPSKSSPCQRPRSLHLPVVLAWCCKNACFHCSCSYLELCSDGSPFFFNLRWWQHHVKVALHFAKLTCGQRVRVLVFAYLCSMSVDKNKKLSLQTFHFCRMVVCATKRSLQNINLLFTTVRNH